MCWKVNCSGGPGGPYKYGLLGYYLDLHIPLVCLPFSRSAVENNYHVLAGTVSQLILRIVSVGKIGRCCGYRDCVVPGVSGKLVFV